MFEPRGLPPTESVAAADPSLFALTPRKMSESTKDSKGAADEPLAKTEKKKKIADTQPRSRSQEERRAQAAAAYSSLEKRRAKLKEAKRMVAADIRELAEDAERQRNEETYFDVEMYDPAPKPKIDVAKTAAHLREVLKDRRRNNLTTADDLPRLSSNLILEENSDRYRMRMTLGPDVAGWLVTGLRIGVDAEIPVAYALDANISNNDRLRCMYGPTLNALVAKLRQTVFSLLVTKIWACTRFGRARIMLVRIWSLI